VSAGALGARAQQAFAEAFGEGLDPQVFVAPGRINVIGEHLDYQEGLVLPAAVDRYTAVALRLRTDGQANLTSPLDGRTHRCRTLPSQRTGIWIDYAIGVAQQLRARGIPVTGFDCAVQSEIPVGAGLASSAALELALARGLLELTGRQLGALDLMEACRQAENTFVGAPTGVMDQYAVVRGRAGHALLLDCRTLRAQPIPLPAAGFEWVLCNSMVKHELAASAYAERRQECQEALRVLQQRLPQLRTLRDLDGEALRHYEQALPPALLRRVTHVVEEGARVEAAVNALRSEALDELGELLYASHRSLATNYEVSCEELDLLVHLASLQPGTLGARMMGGGFGGCTLNLVESERVGPFVRDMPRAYAQRTGIEAEVMVVRVVDGLAPLATGTLTLAPPP
jgi:galactokinase